MLYTVIGRAVGTNGQHKEVVYSGVEESEAEWLTRWRIEALTTSYQRAFGHPPDVVKLVVLPFIPTDEEEDDA